MHRTIFRPAAFAGPLALVLALVPLTLSRAAADEFEPSMIRALANGKMVDTIATEASDAATAAELEVTLSPPLAGAIGLNATSPRYKVTNSDQPDVLSQVPQPVGPGNGNSNYSPLWQLFRVTWNRGTRPSLLSSEVQVLEAQKAGRVTVQPTGIVINGPVVATPDGGSLGHLALLNGFALGDRIQNILTDTNDPGFAAVSENKANNANYAPKLSNLLGSSAVLDLYKFAVAGVFSNPANPDQLTFFETHPQPVGPENGNGDYTPMWHGVAVRFTLTAASPAQYPVITSADQLDAMEAAGKMAESSTNLIVDCPIVGVGDHADEGGQ